MVSGPSVPGSSAQAVSGAMEGSQRKEMMPSRLGLSFLAFFASVTVILCFASLPCVGERKAAPLTPACLASGRETKCTCSDPAAAASAAAASESKQSATISKDTNILSVNCSGSLQFAPTGVKDTVVCSATTEDLKGCTLDILDILPKKPTSVKWSQCTTEAREMGECKALTIPQENLPFFDERFAVGCAEKPSGDQKLCRIPVTIQARASETNGQTVTCAYGAGSNESRQAVTLNPSKNSFTLVCGDKGTVLPTNYETKFCSSDPDDPSTTCDGDYQSILPGFENGWWKKDDPTANSFTLSIPVEKFPTEQAKMVVACQHAKQNTGSMGATREEVLPSVCRVDVTIEAGSPASFSVGSWQLSSLLAFAVTFVLARGM